MFFIVGITFMLVVFAFDIILFLKLERIFKFSFLVYVLDIVSLGIDNITGFFSLRF